MAQSIDVLHPEKPKKVLIVDSNPTISKQTGWPIGFWASEMIHPYWELTEHGYQVNITSPKGGKLEVDAYSDPDDPSGYSEHDLLSKGFLSMPKTRALMEDSKALGGVDPAEYDGLLVTGGEAPMYTFIDDEELHRFVANFYEAGKVTAVICHGTCILLKVKLSNGKLLVEGKTWTGFANSEEDYADQFAGQKIQPFRIEDEARKLPNTNFIVQGRFKSFAVLDGNLITGQQQYSAMAAARLMIEALGV